MDPCSADIRFGCGALTGLVGAEPDSDGTAIRLWVRENGNPEPRREPFQPFCWIRSPDLLKECPVHAEAQPLSGNLPLRALALFEGWKPYERALAWLRRKTAGEESASFFAINDPVQQYLMRSGNVFFKGMAFSDLRRLQLDIETRTTEGFDFPNAEREDDRILAIGLSDNRGWERLFSARDHTEPEMIRGAVEAIRQRDPDVIEGHNLYAFDLPYLMTRARRHGIPFAIGRDGSEPGVRPGRFVAGDRTMSYPRADIAGRNVMDTYFLALSYDVGHRSLPGFGLKAVARHFGLAREGRVQVDVGRMDREFFRDPDRVLAYLSDDLSETRGLAAILSPVVFEQTRILPFGYSTTAIRGTAAKIDGLMLREYLRLERSVAGPDVRRAFSGGLADMYYSGIARNVHHCDIRSLYPSIMLTEKIAPRSDEAGVFLALLERLRDFRVAAKKSARDAIEPERRALLEAMQNSFKILINSFYGYLGFDQARFSDFEAAERVAARGRDLLAGMIEWIRSHGGHPIEIDTDGIYYTPPQGEDPDGQARFREGLAASLPPGINVEFDGEYAAMFSYKVKNYALLEANGDVTLKGAALKSRGLEPFQIKFIRQVIELHLKGESARASALAERFRDAIRAREWPIREFARSERLRDSPEAYAEKVARGGKSRNAAYELARASGRPYRAGDTVRYYITGEKKAVAAHESARLLCECDPLRRDENIAYYLAKLDALEKKFVFFQSSPAQPNSDRAPKQTELSL